MNNVIAALGASILLATAPTSSALIFYFEVPMDGSQEFPGPGDADGTGLAKLWFDSDSNSVIWDIAVADIAPFTLDHIHVGDAGTSGGVRIDFMSSLSGGPVTDPDVALLLANPSGYYVNVHNADFPAGAIRGQIPAIPTAVIPETSTYVSALALSGLGLASWAMRRRHSA